MLADQPLQLVEIGRIDLLRGAHELGEGVLPEVAHQAAGDAGGDPLEERLPLLGGAIGKGPVRRWLPRQQPLLHEPVRDREDGLVVRRRVEGSHDVVDGGRTQAPDGFHDARFELAQHTRQTATVEIESVDIHVRRSGDPNDQRVIFSYTQ